MSHEQMTIVLERPSDAAQLQSFMLGLEVLWPFQIVCYAGDATKLEQFEAGYTEVVDE